MAVKIYEATPFTRKLMYTLMVGMFLAFVPWYISLTVALIGLSLVSVSLYTKFNK